MSLSMTGLFASARWPLALTALLFLGGVAFSAPAASTAPALTATPWRLASLGGVPLTDAQKAADATLILNRAERGAGQAVGSTGCNRFFAGYRAHGERLLFQQVGSTKMACETVRMRLEQRFLDALARSARQQRRGDRLVLFDSRGEELAAFVAGSSPSESGR